LDVKTVNASGSTIPMTSSHDRNQLAPSIEKLFHYLLIHVKKDMVSRVFDENGEVVFERLWRRPKSVVLSPTLYTRLDDCHGAGNCCRVPFDLVYTDYDRSRIVNYNADEIRAQFGSVSADRFERNRAELLSSLIELRATFHEPNGILCWESVVHVKRHTEEFDMSGRKSCRYLFIEGDRYFCGVHPFKPLHCWMPHMTMRVAEPKAEGERTAVNIGRMQYGRNHNFGCPVIFTEVSEDQAGLFGDVQVEGESYFAKQFDDDIKKLAWVSDSAASLGFTSDQNFAVGIDKALRKSKPSIQTALKATTKPAITLWEP
jgi:Fe-S-cluster containining protein